ncbi:hypothetical protein GCM10025862_05950 [Arsenicicoccus piscis]|uniref:Uncharacterized protein n=1 Tax=Arsenicicoccus piscis TaxID=673954 RepID=A0ABQ6HM58_9MICO|nr:hypothetical protein [Arsenicicoccus piscis]GMA18574.1 hypothetical protein GCM10025862_05950 [Arsenicicoccus piscis]
MLVRPVLGAGVVDRARHEEGRQVCASEAHLGSSRLGGGLAPQAGGSVVRGGPHGGEIGMGLSSGGQLGRHPITHDHVGGSDRPCVSVSGEGALTSPVPPVDQPPDEDRRRGDEAEDQQDRRVQDPGGDATHHEGDQQGRPGRSGGAGRVRCRGDRHGGAVDRRSRPQHGGDDEAPLPVGRRGPGSGLGHREREHGVADLQPRAGPHDGGLARDERSVVQRRRVRATEVGHEDPVGGHGEAQLRPRQGRVVHLHVTLRTSADEHVPEGKGSTDSGRWTLADSKLDDRAG